MQFFLNQIKIECNHPTTNNLNKLQVSCCPIFVLAWLSYSIGLTVTIPFLGFLKDSFGSSQTCCAEFCILLAMNLITEELLSIFPCYSSRQNKQGDSSTQCKVSAESWTVFPLWRELEVHFCLYALAYQSGWLWVSSDLARSNLQTEGAQTLGFVGIGGTELELFTSKNAKEVRKRSLTESRLISQMHCCTAAPHLFWC